MTVSSSFGSSVRMESAARLPLCNHLLQHTLRGVCAESEWMYCVFWRILPRNFPPPKWELGGYLDRSKENKRNWILVWEDGFCDFSRSVADADAPDSSGAGVADHAADVSDKSCTVSTVEKPWCTAGMSSRLHPELFFKMSHEIYNYGEGLMGKVAADNGYKWIYRDSPERDNRLVSFWHNTIDPQPRIWEAQFKSGIQTIVVVAVREGLVQLGSSRQVLEDRNFVMLVQRKFNSLQQVAYNNPAQQQQPPLTTAALQSMLSPAEQAVLSSMQAVGQRKVLKRQLGRAEDVEDPGFTRTLDQRRLSWSSSCDSSARPARAGQAPPLFHHLDLDLLSNTSPSNIGGPDSYINYSFTSNSSFSLTAMQQNEHLLPLHLPPAQDVQAAADHLSLSCISTGGLTTSTSSACGVTGSAGSYQSISPCNFRINDCNASMLQAAADLSGNNISSTTCAVPSSTCAESTSTSTGAAAYAARRSVLPCLSYNVQALLSHQLITSPTSTSPVPALNMHHQQMLDDKSAIRLRSPTSRPATSCSASGSSSCQIAALYPTANQNSDLQPATTLITSGISAPHELIEQAQQQQPLMSNLTMPTCGAPARPGAHLRQLQESQDGTADCSATKNNKSSSSNTSVRINSCSSAVPRAGVASVAPIESDPEPAISADE